MVGSRTHSQVAMAQGLNTDEDTHNAPGLQPAPALQLSVICGECRGSFRTLPRTGPEVAA